MASALTLDLPGWRGGAQKGDESQCLRCQQLGAVAFGDQYGVVVPRHGIVRARIGQHAPESEPDSFRMACFL